MTDRLVGYYTLDAGSVGEDGSPRSYIQVLTAGKFKHPKYGEFEVTPDDLQAFARDIQERADRILVDFDHDSTTGRSLAAGWYTGATRIEGNDLFAEVEWTPPGAEAVRTKQYRYVSPEFSRTRRTADGKTVKRHTMFATALTNRPFLPDMAPVSLSASGTQTCDSCGQDMDADDNYCPNCGVKQMSDTDQTYWLRDFSSDRRDQLAKSGKALPDGSFPIVTEEDLRNAIKAYGRASDKQAAKTHIIKRARALGRTDLLPDDWKGSTKATNPEGGSLMELTDIAKGMGLAEEADADAILAAYQTQATELADLKAKLEKAPSEDQLAKLMQSAAKGEEVAKKLHDMERDTTLDQAVRDGRILPVQKDHYAAMFDLDPDKTRALIDATPKGTVKFGPIGSDQAASAPDASEATVFHYSDDQTGRMVGRVDSEWVARRADEILKEQGKALSFTPEEYVAAAQQAQQEALQAA